jgi:hypothetical protein
LLFAAGRASARPNRWWQALVAVLAVSQLATAMVLWPAQAPAPRLPGAARTLEPPLAPSTAGDAAELWSLQRHSLDADADYPSASMPPELLVPADPPLRAFGSPAIPPIN